MITREFPPKSGGIGYYVYNLSKKLLERGHQIAVITPISVSRTRREIVDGIDVFRVRLIPSYPFHIWIYGFFINSLFRSLESQLTLVHLHSPMSPPIRTSLPTITTVHTSMKIDARYHEILDVHSMAVKALSMIIYPPIELNLLRSSTKITAVSQSVADGLNEYGFDPHEVAVVGNGVDESIFSPPKSKTYRDNYVLFTGVLRPRKGLFDLIKCAECVCKVDPDVKFVICGRGPFLSILQEKIRQAKMQKRIMLLGYVRRKKLIQLYQNATVHVVPSHYEGLPTVLLEAMACGLPVVATDIGGINEVITTGENGFLVPPKSPEDMGNTILRLLDDRGLREKIGRAARETIEERYTWDKITDNILEVYEDLL